MADEEPKRRDVLITDETREHINAARTASRESFKSLLPERFWTQRRKARKQALLALRSVINNALSYLDEKVEDKDLAA